MMVNMMVNEFLVMMMMINNDETENSVENTDVWICGDGIERSIV